jgi:hypothetical protein
LKDLPGIQAQDWRAFARKKKEWSTHW